MYGNKKAAFNTIKNIGNGLVIPSASGGYVASTDDTRGNNVTKRGFKESFESSPTLEDELTTRDLETEDETEETEDETDAESDVVSDAESIVFDIEESLPDFLEQAQHDLAATSPDPRLFNKESSSRSPNTSAPIRMTGVPIRSPSLAVRSRYKLHSDRERDRNRDLTQRQIIDEGRKQRVAMGNQMTGAAIQLIMPDNIRQHLSHERSSETSAIW